MTAYRFRVKFAPDPTSLWRDIVVGADRTIAEFQSAINPAVGLDQTHLWFIRNDEEYWDSEVNSEMARQLSLEQYDRICYLYDYGDEWRFYAILKEVLDDEPSDTEPAVVNTEGESIDQYGSSRERRF
jgi:hypothetical protein